MLVRASMERQLRERGTKTYMGSSKKLIRENDFHAEFMEAEPYEQKSAKVLSVAEA